MKRIIPAIACFAAASFLATPPWGQHPAYDTEYLDSESEVDIDPSSSSVTTWSYAEIEGTDSPDVYIEIEATLDMNGSEIDYSYTDDYGYAEVDLDDAITEVCVSYDLYSDSDSWDEDLDLYADADSSASAFGPVPTGETTTGTDSWGPDPLGTVFSLSLVPSGTLFDGGYVNEDLSGFDDGCYDISGIGVPAPGPEPQGEYVGSGGTYADVIAGPLWWIDRYLDLVSTGQIPGGCGWSVNQTMNYWPPWSDIDYWSYAYNNNGQNIVYGHASAALQTCRGSSGCVWN
jgi:hypothetical protein